MLTETQNIQDMEDVLPPLRPVKLPKVLTGHQPALSDSGWTTITYEANDTLYSASEALLDASKAFFALPQTHKEKYRIPPSEGDGGDGWSSVEGEKEFLTLRSVDTTPPELKDAVTSYWNTAAGLLHDMLGQISVSLGLPPDSLTVYSEPCKKLGSKRTATMLRLFRYEGFEGTQSKVVAEAHRDLGLLSLVIGDKPGLEVYDRNINQWFQIEQYYQAPAATVLVGRQLALLSNSRYTAGGHLVRSYPNPIEAPSPSPTDPSQNYRYSIVLALRAHSPVPVNTDNLTSSITGKFQNPIRDTAGAIFRQISQAHYNVNTTHEEREKQREKMARGKQERETVLKG